MLMFTYPEIKLSFPLANTHTMMDLVQLSHLGNPGSDPIQFSIVPIKLQLNGVLKYIVYTQPVWTENVMNGRQC